MQFNIAPQDLQGMISRVSGFATQLYSISGAMRSYANQLGSSWKDPQYIAFIGQVESMSHQLKSSEESLRIMEQQLKILKANLERAHSEFRRL